MFSFKIGLKKLILFLAILIVIPIILCIYPIGNSNKYQGALFYLVLLTYTIIGFFIFNKKIVLFEPIVLFSAYYITVLISGFVLISTNFATNVFIQNTSLIADLPTLMTHACMYYFFGYICTLFGYYLVKNNNLENKFIFESKQKISDNVVNIFIIIFLVIGIGNFMFNIFEHAGGNIFIYMANISIREYEFAVSGTTFGYMFAETAMYVWYFKLIRNGSCYSKLFLVMLVVVVLMRISTGRAFSVIVYVGSFIGIYYFLKLNARGVKNNAKYFIGLIGLASCGIAIYMLRIISSLEANDLLIGTVHSNFQNLLGMIIFLAVDFGYIPNTGVLMKIIDSWDSDIGYLNGQSLLTWIFNGLPSALKPINYQPSVMIKQTWYSHIPVGSLPPTGVGEMYANFGIIGPFIGMFLFGCLCAYFYNFTLRSKNYWVLAIFVQITIGFIMLYPKGEFDNLSLLTVMPILFTVLAMKIASCKSSTQRIHLVSVMARPVGISSDPLPFK